MSSPRPPEGRRALCDPAAPCAGSSPPHFLVDVFFTDAAAREQRLRVAPRTPETLRDAVPTTWRVDACA